MPLTMANQANVTQSEKSAEKKRPEDFLKILASSLAET